MKVRKIISYGWAPAAMVGLIAAIFWNPFATYLAVMGATLLFCLIQLAKAGHGLYEILRQKEGK